MSEGARQVLLDYYAVLQVHPEVDAEVIEAAYVFSVLPTLALVALSTRLSGG